MRDAEVDHETERENSESEIVGENSVSDLVQCTSPFLKFLESLLSRISQIFRFKRKELVVLGPQLYINTQYLYKN